MKIFIIDSIFFFLLIAFFSNSVFSATSENASLESAKPITKNESEISVAETGSRAAQSTNSSNKKNSTYNELVVVSKNPDFFSYILSSIAILLTVITILVGVITGTGLAIVIKLYRERKKLEEIRVSFDKEQKEIGRAHV